MVVRSSENEQGWEHSRYKNWRPSYKETSRWRRGDTYDPNGRPVYRSSILGGIWRCVLWVGLFIGVIGPGFDFANGVAKAQPGGCDLVSVLDGGRVLVDCPGDDLVQERRIAGYVAPDLFQPVCLQGAASAALAAIDIRRALHSAERIRIQSVAPVPVAVASTDAPATEDAPDLQPLAPAVRIMVDGVDLATIMLADGRAKTEQQIADGEGWCA